MRVTLGLALVGIIISASGLPGAVTETVLFTSAAGICTSAFGGIFGLDACEQAYYNKIAACLVEHSPIEE